MNVYDSARIADVLAPHGYEPTDGPADADLVVLNTCNIREKATEKVYSDLGRLRLVRDERRAMGADLKIAVAGCVAQAEGDAMAKRAKYVDVVVGPQAYHRLPELLARRDRAAGAVVDTSFPADSKFDSLPAVAVPDAPTAFLTVQEGCDKFCTFCVVPYTRGAEESRPVDAVLAEARSLAAGGVREITVLGQNVNAYHGQAADGREWGLARLLCALAEIDGIARLRYTTSHPADMDEALIAAHGDLPQLMPFLHLPVQSGADGVLQAMNRRCTADDYRRLVDRLRTARPDLALSSDFIVGFPGESDADFQDTLQLVRDVGFAQAFSFHYSPRPGTPATLLRKHVSDAVKRERLHELQALLATQQRAFNLSMVGRETEILIEGPGRHPRQMMGRSPYLQPVHLQVDQEITANCGRGQLIDVRIDGAVGHSLSGSIIEPVALGAVA